MITCHVRYIIDPYQINAFERYSRSWIPVVTRMGGQHHGYFLPAEGANNVAYCLFSFSGLADYERYRQEAAVDPECLRLVEEASELKFIVSYERTFLRPLLA
ncbi:MULTISPECIES: NIPSNAP family protein [Pseudomonas]|uniref:NIPSNAP family protein n=1 Tax=Pseudomonas putida TaxID=303 RepID=A0A1L5PRV1_PSEPU|nr:MULTISPECIES: NIPSNAP family protein [Pseudomonas]APO82851.1 NIPSNAP family protein [Pseudomonas putida]MDV5098986.1 NIPSNAP family protein [Pseudomonas sp. LSJ-87]